MVKKPLLLLLLPVLMFVPNVGLTQLFPHITQITTDDGLAQNLIFDIVQDHTGYLWFGTKDGLSRYDGYEFRTFRNNPSDSTSLSNNYVTFIQEDANGNLWVQSSPGGLHLYNPLSDTFVRLNSIKIIPQSFLQSRTMHIAPQEHGGWNIVSTSGIYYLSSDLKYLTEIPLPTEEPITIESTFIIPGSENVYYLNTSRNDILRFDSDTMVLTPLQGINDVIQNRGITHFLKSSSGNWMLTGHNIIYTFSSEGEFVRQFRIPTTFDNQTFPVRDFREDRYGRFWISRDGVLYEYLPEEERVEELPTPGLNTTLFIDRTGIFWIGTTGFGLYKYNPTIKRFGLTSARFHDIMAPDFNDLMEDENYFGYPRIFGDIFYVEHLSAEQRLVLTRRLGIVRLHTTNKTLERLPIITHPFNHDLSSAFWMDRNQDGTYSILLSDGMMTYSLTDGPIDFLHNEVIFPDFISERNQPTFELLTVIRNFGGTYWIGSTESGLASYNPVTGEQRTFQYQNRDNSSISSNHILSLHQQGEYLWVGTDGGGLNRIHIDSGSILRITDQEGLPNNVIYAIYADSSGYLWMSTNKGIAAMNPKTLEVQSFIRSDGLQSNEFNRREHYQFDDGRLLFCGLFGCNLFNPNEFVRNPVSPKVVFTDISVMNQTVLPLASDWFHTDQNAFTTLNVNWNQNIIGFQFAALDFSASDKNRYKYRFPPFVTEWTEIGTRREVFFTNLDPGTYRLEVMGTNNDGVWSTSPAVFGVNVIPPFWMRPWFRVSSILLAFSITALVVWFISEQKHQRSIRMLEYKLAVDQERLRISRDMHDDLGARLTQIRLMSELVRNDTSFPDNVKNKLGEISSEAKHIIQNFNEIVWSLNPKNDTLSNLSEFMIHYSESFCEKVNIPCRIIASEQFPDVEISSGVRTNLLSILKEALNNAAKYASCSEIQIHIQLERDNYTLKIMDNGTGFNQSSPSTGNGIASMQHRADALGAHLQIVSEHNKGTQISLVWNIRTNPKG